MGDVEVEGGGMMAKQSCGHPMEVIYSGVGGTNHCEMCRLEAEVAQRKLEWKELEKLYDEMEENLRLEHLNYLDIEKDLATEKAKVAELEADLAQCQEDFDGLSHKLELAVMKIGEWKLKATDADRELAEAREDKAVLEEHFLSISVRQTETINTLREDLAVLLWFYEVYRFGKEAMNVSDNAFEEHTLSMYFATGEAGKIAADLEVAVRAG